jgi:hypothetical protein
MIVIIGIVFIVSGSGVGGSAIEPLPPTNSWQIDLRSNSIMCYGAEVLSATLAQGCCRRSVSHPMHTTYRRSQHLYSHQFLRVTS